MVSIVPKSVTSMVPVTLLRIVTGARVGAEGDVGLDRSRMESQP